MNNKFKVLREKDIKVQYPDITQIMNQAVTVESHQKLLNILSNNDYEFEQNFYEYHSHMIIPGEGVHFIFKLKI